MKRIIIIIIIITILLKKENTQGKSHLPKHGLA